MAETSIEPSPIQAGLTGCCPRCGARTLFASWIKFAGRCRACGLDFSQFNVGDGPAAFLTLFIGAIIAGSAIAVELIFSPPFWVHILLWPPITLGLILLALRAGKGVLLALEYRNAAREGRIDTRI
ncbi:DUF983 domain-containing protein [Sphingomonas sp. MMS24-J13]|uniref:DUF983 domain-containing protein n=1 Tax=Sphingomonas sp. MMS24-J13 TaxID=3238686 RepID=UPI00384BCC77